MVRVVKKIARGLAGGPVLGKAATLGKAAILGICAMGTAHAQTANGFPGQESYFTSLNAADVAQMLTEFDIETQLRPPNEPGRSPALVASLGSGAKFLIGFFQCEDVKSAQGCKQIMISTAQPVAGASFEDLNSFNGVSNVTTVVYDTENQILIFGRNVFVPGGIGRENFKLSVVLFLNDMQRFVEGRQSGVASVAFNKTPDIKSKITSITAGGRTPLANRMLISSDASTEIEVAINNSAEKSFAVEYDLLD